MYLRQSALLGIAYSGTDLVSITGVCAFSDPVHCKHLQSTMPYCLAFGCNSHSGRKTGENVSFHSFPKGTENLDVARVWYARCGTDLGVSVDKFYPEQFNKSKMFLCSKHFRSTDFANNAALNMGFRFRRLLKPGVTPTIFQWQSAPGKPNCNRKLSVSRTKKKEKQEVCFFIDLLLPCFVLHFKLHGCLLPAFGVLL